MKGNGDPIHISQRFRDSREKGLKEDYSKQSLAHSVASEYRPITAEAINKTFERICHQYELNTQAGLYGRIHSETTRKRVQK